MKTFKLLALIVGTIGLIFSLNSCKKDKDNDDNNVAMDCCTFSYTYHNITHYFKACSNGYMRWTSTDGDDFTYSWIERDIYDSWEDAQYEFISSGGSCD